MSEFSDRFTVIPDTGDVELHCSAHADRNVRKVGYHPSLDVLIETARSHNAAEHAQLDACTDNDQFVGGTTTGMVHVTMPKAVMTKAEAIRHAAWLVLVADGEDEFPAVLAAIKGA